MKIPPYPTFHLRAWVVALCGIVLLGAVLLLLLNLEGVIPGPWTSFLSALCALLGVFFAFLEWQRGLKSVALLPDESLTLVRELRGLRVHPLGVSKRRGAIIATAHRQDLQATIHLCPGFTSQLHPAKMVAPVGEYVASTGVLIAALFPGLKPGNYTLFFEESSRKLFVTVRAGEIATVDWGRKRREVGGRDADSLRSRSEREAW